MKNKPQNRRIQIYLLALIGIAGCTLVLACTPKYGVGVTPDSAMYIGMARSLLESRDFVDFTVDKPACQQPYIYPTLLAGAKLAGVDYFTSARYISAVSFGFIIFLSGLWTLRKTGFLILAILCSVSTVLAVPLFHISSMAWSEPLFIALLMAYFFCLSFTIENPTIKRGLLLALSAAVLCLTRYIGVVVLPIGAILLLVYLTGTFWKRLAFAAVWSLLSVMPLSLWLLRNYLLTGTLTGPRYRSSGGTPFFENLEKMGGIIASWALPSQIFEKIPGVIFAVILIALVVYMCRKRDQLILSLFFILYSTVILAVTTLTTMTSLDNRYLSPLYIPISLLFWSGTANIFSRLKEKNALIRFGILAGFCIGIWFTTGSSYALAWGQKLYNTGCWGFRNAYWQQSETIRWLQTYPLKGKVYTNEIAALYILTDIKPTGSPVSPSIRGSSPPEWQQRSLQEVRDFKEILKSEENTYLVWFLHNPRPWHYDPNQLQKFCRLKLLRKLKDGVILQLFPKK